MIKKLEPYGKNVRSSTQWQTVHFIAKNKIYQVFGSVWQKSKKQRVLQLKVETNA